MRLMRWGFNLHPTWRSTGAHLTYIADDWHEVRVALPLSWRTRNYVGTMFGGAMYSAVDPFYMIMLIKILGPQYVVWDKAATIRFKKPGRGTLHARFVIEPEEVGRIVAELDGKESIERTFRVDLTDAEGTVHAEVEKLIYIARRKASDAHAR